MLFEVLFVDGMVYLKNCCLEVDKKIGRKIVKEVFVLYVLLIYNGEYYIVKGGY